MIFFWWILVEWHNDRKRCIRAQLRWPNSFCRICFQHIGRLIIHRRIIMRVIIIYGKGGSVEIQKSRKMKRPIMLKTVHLFPNCWDKMVGPTVFGSRHCKNGGAGMNFGPSVGNSNTNNLKLSEPKIVGPDTFAKQKRKRASRLRMGISPPVQLSLCKDYCFARLYHKHHSQHGKAIAFEYTYSNGWACGHS